MKKNLVFLVMIAVSSISFAEEKNALVGRWIGTVSNPWTTPYNVGFIFNKDGTYASQSMGPTCMGSTNTQIIGTSKCSLVSMPALYWGSDGSNKKKIYELVSDDENNLKGFITIYFSALGASPKKSEEDKGTTVKVPFQSIDIRTVKNDGDIDTYLEFSIYRQDIKTIGPVKYSLKKLPEIGQSEDYPSPPANQN